MYKSYSEVKWGQWHTCDVCRCEETLLEDNEENRKHWSWGRYKTRDKLKFSYHEKTQSHLDHFKKYRCDDCDVQCWSNKEYVKHCDTSKHKKINKIVIECKMCEYTTCSKASMEQHNLTQKHQNNLAGIEKENFKCEPCGYSTHFKSRMEQHNLTRKHNEKRIEPEEYTCSVCNYTTEFKQRLHQHNMTQKHKNKVAGIVEEINLHCEKCNYTAASKGLMEQHNKTKKHNKKQVE